MSKAALLSALALILALVPVHSLAARQSDDPFAVYYVDSDLGRDDYTCEDARHLDTPKRSVKGVLACRPGAGDIVKFRGVFTETIMPPESGEVLYDVQAIPSVAASHVTFNVEPQGLTADVDYVAVYNSRKGNSGAFRVIAVKGATVYVDTSSLPGGKFLDETADDPGDLQAAILRPVHYTAWDVSNPPLWHTAQQTFHSVDQSVVMVSYLHSDSFGPDQGAYVWPAFEIDGTPGGNADFHIFDHLLVEHAEAAIATEFEDFHSNYSIIQYNTLQNIGYPGNASDEIIYWGAAYHPERHYDFCQIMYNRVGPHNAYALSLDISWEFAGDGIELKPSAHGCTVFGNEIVGTNAINACDDAPLRVSGPDTFIANNYIHDINPQPASSRGCGISLISTPEDGGAHGSIVANNIIANVKQVGIRVLDTSNVQILNNVIYNVFPVGGCTSCTEDTAGILVTNYADRAENILIRNNIVHTTLTGIGRYEWARPYPFSITSDHNIVYGAQVPFGSQVPQSDSDQIADPDLIDPSNGNFAIGPDSPARDSGLSMTDVLLVDKHDADQSGVPTSGAVSLRDDHWDIGAYEYEAEAVCAQCDARWLVALGIAGGLLVSAAGSLLIRHRVRAHPGRTAHL